jgi:hypothetical protein
MGKWRNERRSRFEFRITIVKRRGKGKVETLLSNRKCLS